MAAEKYSDNRQSIVDQDAAITAYLDGLLRDPDADEPPEPSAPRRVPGLKVINVPEAPVVPQARSGSSPPVAQAADDRGEVEPSSGAGDAWRPEAGVLGQEPVTVADEPATDEAPTPTESPADTSVEEAEPGTQAAAESAVSPGSEAVVEPGRDGRWGWLRVGGMTMAIPGDAVTARYPEPALDPVPGAPAHVAGALAVDGRPRLILSLAALAGIKERNLAAREVLLLGQGGLWGVVGERVDRAPELDDQAVEWRGEEQKAHRRPWLAGTAPTAGVAVLDVAGLRAALRASR
ncbi:MAG: chemotaxis protein CheW [Guyparkeria sp.]